MPELRELHSWTRDGWTIVTGWPNGLRVKHGEFTEWPIVIAGRIKLAAYKDNEGNLSESGVVLPEWVERDIEKILGVKEWW